MKKLLAGVLSVAIAVGNIVSGVLPLANAVETDVTILAQAAYDATADEKQIVGVSGNDAQTTCCGLSAKDKARYDADGTLQKRMDYFESLSTTTAPSLLQNIARTVPSVTLPSLPDIYSTDGYMPSTGNVKILALGVSFEDYQHPEDTQSFISALDGLGDFYYRSSYGKLSITYNYVTCKVSHPRSHYEDPYGDGSYDTVYGRELLLQDALSLVDEQVDLRDYDSDGDGSTDGVYLYFAGGDAGWGSEWWSYLANSHYDTAADGIAVKKYVFLHSDSVEVMRHETGHILGLDDYYDNRYDNGTNIAHSFDIMYDGFANDHNSVSKLLLGWINSPVIIADTDTDIGLELRPIEQFPDAAIIYPNGDTTSNELFVLEYIDNVSFLRNGEYGGIRIWRVNCTLTEDGTGFRYSHYSGEIPFTQVIGGGNDFLTSEGNVQMMDYGQEYYLSLLYTGGTITPYTAPSSFIYGEDGTLTGPFSFSGVHITDVNTLEETASATVYIESAPQNDMLSWEIQKSGDNCLLFKIAFSSEVYLPNGTEGITVTANDGTVVPSTVLFNTDDPNCSNTVIFIRANDGIKSGMTYTLHIPSGTFRSSWGEENSEIIDVIDSNFAAINKIDKNIDIYGNASDTYLLSDGTLGFFSVKDGNTVLLNRLTKDTIEQKVVYSSDSIQHLNVRPYDENVFFVRMFDEGQVVTCKYDDNTGDFQKIMTHESLNELLLPWRDGFLSVDGQQFFGLSIDGEQTILDSELDLMFGSLYYAGNDQYMFAYYSGIISLRNDMLEKICEVNLRTQGLLAPDETVQSIQRLDDDSIALFTSCSRSDGFYVLLIDNELNFIKKTQFCVNDPFRGMISHVSISEDRIVVAATYTLYKKFSEDGWLGYEQISRIWFLDSSLQTTATFTFSQDGIGTSFGALLPLEDGRVIVDHWANVFLFDNISAEPIDTTPLTEIIVTRQPIEQTLTVGEMVTLCVEAEGSELRYQWQYFDSETMNWRNLEITSSTESVISFILDESAESRKYRCLIFDGNGGIASSDAAELVVIPQSSSTTTETETTTTETTTTAQPTTTSTTTTTTAQSTTTSTTTTTAQSTTTSTTTTTAQSTTTSTTTTTTQSTTTNTETTISNTSTSAETTASSTSTSTSTETTVSSTSASTSTETTASSTSASTSTEPTASSTSASTSTETTASSTSASTSTEPTASSTSASTSTETTASSTSTSTSTETTTSTTTTSTAATTVIKGDADHDGDVDMDDANKVLYYVNGAFDQLGSTAEEHEAIAGAVDIDGDGAITKTDAALIMGYTSQDTTWEELSSAIVPAADVDMTELNAKLAEAEAIVNDNTYTEESYAVLREAIQAVKATQNAENLPSDYAEHMTNLLENAMDGLEENLPQTGYSTIYNYILLAAAAMVLFGIYAVAQSRKEQDAE